MKIEVNILTPINQGININFPNFREVGTTFKVLKISQAVKRKAKDLEKPASKTLPSCTYI